MLTVPSARGFAASLRSDSRTRSLSRVSRSLPQLFDLPFGDRLVNQQNIDWRLLLHYELVHADDDLLLALDCLLILV